MCAKCCSQRSSEVGMPGHASMAHRAASWPDMNNLAHVVYCIVLPFHWRFDAHSFRVSGGNNQWCTLDSSTLLTADKSKSPLYELSTSSPTLEGGNHERPTCACYGGPCQQTKLQAIKKCDMLPGGSLVSWMSTPSKYLLNHFS